MVTKSEKWTSKMWFSLWQYNDKQKDKKNMCDTMSMTWWLEINKDMVLGWEE